MIATHDLLALWDRLSAITSLTFVAKSADDDVGWNGRGRGVVAVEQVDSGTLVFDEKGEWTSDDGKELSFTNVYRWTLLTDSGFLGLEHLRFGSEEPVYLFDLGHVSGATWASIEPHVCRADLYTAELELGEETILLNWTIEGPVKSESIHYSYQ